MSEGVYRCVRVSLRLAFSILTGDVELTGEQEVAGYLCLKGESIQAVGV